MQNGGLRTRGIIKKSTPEHPLITVVTVVFNGEATLEQTIQSVVNQTYDNVEYIIVDGGSKDRTLDIIKKYEDRIDYWQSEPDKGIYDAMNKAIELASGDWINFMNAGDEFYSDSVITTVFKDRIYNCSVIFGMTNQVFDFGKRIIFPKQMTKNSKHLEFCHQSCFTNRIVLIEYKYNTKYRICADYDLYHRLLIEGKKFIFVNQIISTYDNSGGISSNLPCIKYKEEIEIFNSRYQRVKYLLFCMKIYIKRGIKHIMPKKILQKYRQIRFL